MSQILMILRRKTESVLLQLQAIWSVVHEVSIVVKLITFSLLLLLIGNFEYDSTQEVLAAADVHQQSNVNHMGAVTTAIGLSEKAPSRFLKGKERTDLFWRNRLPPKTAVNALGMTLPITTPIPISADSDFDGISDNVECNWAATCPDSDGDGLQNHVDIDSDNDGIPDRIEAVVVAAVVTLGRQDFDPVDLDGDGLPDYLDPDSDNDSVPDSVEGNDANQDGVADVVPEGQDLDQDGLDSAFDLFNGEHSEENAAGSRAALPNTSGGLPNWRNGDDDGDGMLTIVEIGTDRNFPIDDDNDGVPNYLQPNVLSRTYLPLITR